MNIFTIQLFFFIAIIFCAKIHSKEYKISFYNVENLFDLRDDGSEYPLYIPNKNNWCISTLRKKHANIGKVIENLNASIIGLAEVENRNTLNLLLNEGTLSKRYSYHLFTKEKYAPNGLALLSIFPVVAHSSHTISYDDDFRTRPILEADIAFPHDTLRILLCHWPSRKHAELRRIKVAQKILSIIDTTPTSRPFLIMGDLNSNFNEHDYSPDKLPAINRILSTGTCTPERFIPFSAQEIKDNSLFNPWSESENSHFSYIYKGEKETIDNFLLPHSLIKSRKLHYVPLSFSAETSRGGLLRNQKPYRWQIIQTRKGPKHEGAGFSDHLPISLLLSDTQQLTPHKPMKKNRPFAFSTEGWQICSQTFRAERIFLSEEKRERVLYLSGKSDKNKTVITKIFTPPCKAKTIELPLCGTATYYIRFKQDNSPWLYLRCNGDIKKSAKYESFHTQCWQTIKIPCQGIEKSVTLQIKSYANKVVDLYIGAATYRY